MKNVQVSWEQLFADDDFRLECWREILVLKAMVVPVLKKNTIHVTDGY